MKKNRVSLDDIAQSLGVSPSLVSLVLNDKDAKHGISAETRQRVLDKAKELNYKPNHFARGLRIGKSFTIGLIVSDIANGFYSRIARNLEDLAVENGYNLITCSTDEDIERELRQIKHLKEKQVDGLIISSSQKNAIEFNTLKSEGFPVVLIDRFFEDSEVPSVVVQNREGAKIAASHLVAQGYKKPLVVAIAPAHVYTIKERCEGFIQEMCLHSINPTVVNIPFENPFDAVEMVIEELVDNSLLPDCIFAINNNLASACLQALRKHNMNVPNDIGLISFDDVPYFNFMNPSITAISQPVDEISHLAFEMLMSSIKGEQNVVTESLKHLPIELIVRESTDKNR